MTDRKYSMRIKGLSALDFLSVIVRHAESNEATDQDTLIVPVGVLREAKKHIDALERQVSEMQTASSPRFSLSDIKGKFVDISGSTEPLSRTDLNRILTKHGANTHYSLTAKTDYLFIGKNANSRKIQKAQYYGVPIILVETFLQCLEKEGGGSNGE